MKILISYLLMISGFVWILGISFGTYHHTAWIAHSQSLDETEEIKRIEATSAMRDLSLNLKDYYRIIILPTSLILVGGILNNLNTKKQNSRCGTTPNGAPVFDVLQRK